MKEFIDFPTPRSGIGTDVVELMSKVAQQLSLLLKITTSKVRITIPVDASKLNTSVNDCLFKLEDQILVGVQKMEIVLTSIENLDESVTERVHVRPIREDTRLVVTSPLLRLTKPKESDEISR
jgi:hypothetical protein